MTTQQLIRTARKHAGLTQRGLAELIGVPQPRIAQWETTTVPRADTLLKILEATKYDKPLF